MTLKRVLLTCAFFTLGALPAAAGGLVGRVAEWEGDPAAIVVRREGAAVQPLQRGMAILEDDTVDIAASDAHLRLRLANGETTVLSAGASRITAAEPPPGVSVKLWSWSVGLLGQMAQKAGPAATQAVAMTTRTDGRDQKLSAPLIQGEKTRMLESRGNGLHLAWTGGKPPYRVTIQAIRDGRYHVVLATPLLAAPRLNMPALPLPAGDYLIEIDDSCGTDVDCRKIESGIEVLPASAVPPPPSGVDPLAVPANPGERLVQLLWLAAVDDMAWSLEVYQRVANETADPDLVALRRVLEEGGRLTPQ